MSACLFQSALEFLELFTPSKPWSSLPQSALGNLWFLPGLSSFLALVDLISERQRHALRLGADSDVSCDGSLWFGGILLQTHISQRVLSEN